MSWAWVAAGKPRFGTRSCPNKIFVQNPKYFVTLFTGSLHLYLDSFLFPYIHHFSALSVPHESRELGREEVPAPVFQAVAKLGLGQGEEWESRGWIPGIPGWSSKLFSNQCWVPCAPWVKLASDLIEVLQRPQNRDSNRDGVMDKVCLWCVKPAFGFEWSDILHPLLSHCFFLLPYRSYIK